MYGIEETIARNGSTKADIEGGSFTLTADGIRVPIFAGIAGEQIDSLECPESHTEERRAELRKALAALSFDEFTRTCDACGSITPVGQSCGCFDNGCQ